MYSWPSISTATNHGSKTVFSTCSWECMDAEDWQYALFYTVLYMALEHLQIFVCAGVLKPIPARYHGTIKVGGESKDIHKFFTLWGLVTLTPMLFKCQLYYERKTHLQLNLHASSSPQQINYTHFIKVLHLFPIGKPGLLVLAGLNDKHLIICKHLSKTVCENFPDLNV